MQFFLFASLLAAAAASPLSASSPNGNNGASNINMTSPLCEARKELYTVNAWPTSTVLVGLVAAGNYLTLLYATYAMDSRYSGENTTVRSYNVQERAHLQVHVKDGRLYNSQGRLVDTSAADEGQAEPAAIFAMGPGGRILLSNSHKKGSLHTSSFFAGNPVAGVGEMVVKNGVIQKIRAVSAYYLPNTDLNRQVVQSLRDQGYTDHIDSVMCNEE